MKYITPDLVALADQRAARASEYLDALVADERRNGHGCRAGDSLGVACLAEIVTRICEDERSMAEVLAIAIRRLAAPHHECRAARGAHVCVKVDTHCDDPTNDDHQCCCGNTWEDQ